MVFNVHKTIRLIRDGEKGVGGGGGGEQGLYTYRYIVTTRMTPALRWAAMTAVLMFHLLWGTKSQDSVHRPQLLKRKESRGPSAYQPNALSLGQTGSQVITGWANKYLNELSLAQSPTAQFNRLAASHAVDVMGWEHQRETPDHYGVQDPSLRF